MRNEELLRKYQPSRIQIGKVLRKFLIIWHWIRLLGKCLRKVSRMWPHRLLKIDLQLHLFLQRSRDDSIADQRSSIFFSYFYYQLLMIIVYTACILNCAHKIAVFNFFWLTARYLERCPLLSMKRGCREGCSRDKNRTFLAVAHC